jgi:DHA1 family bicyclomycin/chloramphenicol resistance-like MFS transporter
MALPAPRRILRLTVVRRSTFDARTHARTHPQMTTSPDHDPGRDETRATHARMTPATLELLLTLLLGIQPIATDLSLPALPTLQRMLGASVSQAQLTLSALIGSFGLAQLVWGPLSDRFGRRPILLVGLALFALASVMSALAADIGSLIVWRALQGAAMAAAVTCARSIVRDLFQPHEGARVMSRALSGLGVIAMSSPLIGGAAVQWLHWRAALAVLAVFGAVTLALVAWRFEETVPLRDARATRLGPLLRNWGSVLADPTFRAWVALLCCTYGGLFIMLAGSSFVFIGVLGVSRVACGALLATSSIAYIAGTLLCRRLLLRHGMRATVRRGAWLSLAGGVGMAALSLAGVYAVWAVIVPQWLYAMGHGIHQPCGQAGAVGPFPEKAGTAASVSGFLMMLTAMGAGLWLGRALDGADTVRPVTLGIGAMSVLLAAVAWTLVQRHGDAPPRAAPLPAAAGS